MTSAFLIVGFAKRAFSTASLMVLGRVESAEDNSKITLAVEFSSSAP